MSDAELATWIALVGAWNAAAPADRGSVTMVEACDGFPDALEEANAFRRAQCLLEEAGFYRASTREAEHICERIVARLEGGGDGR